MKPLPQEPGVYTITHTPTGHFYIGSTGNLRARITNHKSTLRNSRHGNSNLQAAFTAVENIEVTAIPTDSVKAAKDAEQELLDIFLQNPLCCNIGNGASSTWLPGNVPEDVRELARAANIGNCNGKGHAVTDEMRDAVRKTNTGLRRSEETLKRMSESNIRRTVSISGVEYKCARDAAIAMGVTGDYIRNRIYSTLPQWADWMYV